MRTTIKHPILQIKVETPSNDGTLVDIKKYSKVAERSLKPCVIRKKVMGGVTHLLSIKCSRVAMSRSTTDWQNSFQRFDAN